MKFLFKNLFAIILLLIFCFSLTGYVAGAQQMTAAQRQTLITQIAQQIAQLQAQIAQILAQQQIGSGIPIRIKVPKINVDAIIDPVGITPLGEVGVPKGPTHTAWFNVGPRPGDVGNAVVTGHYGTWKNGGGSVFDNLNKLVKGDKIYIKDDKGVTITFVVQKLRTYGRNEYAPEVFSSSDEMAHLNLITCNGVWDGILKTYSNRLVVFANKE